jgi:hypothetical protein
MHRQLPGSHRPLQVFDAFFTTRATVGTGLGYLSPSSLSKGMAAKSVLIAWSSRRDEERWCVFSCLLILSTRLRAPEDALDAALFCPTHIR